MAKSSRQSNFNFGGGKPVFYQETSMSNAFSADKLAKNKGKTVGGDVQSMRVANFSMGFT